MRTAILFPFCLAMNGLMAQDDGYVAYVPSRPPEHTADDERVGFVEGTLPSTVELSLPVGTYQVDLLNARGKVKQSFAAGAIDQIDLTELSPGTWTLRARTPEGLCVRRFAVLTHGGVRWTLPQPKRPK
ncbi:MAG: T9SS type A sorting domain-containing protein [Flavobacteriales bacterium]